MIFLPVTIILISQKCSHFLFLAVFSNLKLLEQALYSFILFILENEAPWQTPETPWRRSHVSWHISPARCNQKWMQIPSPPLLNSRPSPGAQVLGQIQFEGQLNRWMDGWEQCEGTGGRSFVASPGSEAVRGTGPASRTGPRCLKQLIP